MELQRGHHLQLVHLLLFLLVDLLQDLLRHLTLPPDLFLLRGDVNNKDVTRNEQNRWSSGTQGSVHLPHEDLQVFVQSLGGRLVLHQQLVQLHPTLAELQSVFQ